MGVKKYKYKGKDRTLSDIAWRANIKRDTLRYRLRIHGDDIDKALAMVGNVTGPRLIGDDFSVAYRSNKICRIAVRGKKCIKSAEVRGLCRSHHSKVWKLGVLEKVGLPRRH